MGLTKKLLPFTQGTCFICGNRCNLNNYVHYECAVAYENEKEKKIKEMKNEENNKEKMCLLREDLQEI